MAHTKVTKNHTQNTGTANTFSYSGSFDTFKESEVVVTLDAVKLTYTSGTINESASPREYSVDYTAKTIHIGGADLSSGTIIIRPETDMGSPTARATYTAGSSVTATDLNNNNLQLLRKALEYDDQKLSSIGGTMTGHLTMGEDTTIIFEGATDDGYETTLTVTDPTADRTIYLPNASDTLVGKATTDTLTNKTIALGNNTVSGSFAQLNNAVTDASLISTTSSDSLSNKTLTSPVLNTGLSGSAFLDEDDMASNSATKVASQQSIKAYTDSGSQTLTNKTISADNNTLSGIAGSSFVVSNSSGNIDGSASQKAIPSGTVVGTSDSQTLTNKSIDSDNNTITNIVNADIKAGAAIAHNKLANVTDGQILVGNGANVPTAVAVSGDVTIANTGAVTIANNAVEIGMLGCEQTSGNLTSSDSHIPTSAAVATYVQSKIDPIGGLEVIETQAHFPETQPAAGVIISIENAGGIVVSSNSSTTPDTVDTDTQVTINQFPNDITGTIADRVGLMVTSTGSSQIYNYHKALLKESDLVNLSTDIQDFGNRYRVGTKTSNSDSSNDDGDLFFDTGTNKMYVYDGVYNSGGSWKEVTSAGDFKILTIKDHDQAVGGSGPTFNGSNEEFDLFDGSADASITNAAQLVVSLNGIIQKPNSGSFDGNEEGFYLNDTHGIKFCDPPPSGSTLFVTQIGTATTIGTPGTGSISNANMFAAGVINPAAIGTSAVETAKIDDNAVTLAKMAGGTDGQIITYDASGDPIAVGPGTDGQVLTSTGAGSPPAFEDITSSPITALNNATANELVTVGSTTTELDAESALTFDGNHLTQTITGNGGHSLTSTGNHAIQITANTDRAAENNTLLSLRAQWNDTQVAMIDFQAGDDTTNKDNSKIAFYTAPAGTQEQHMVIESNGNVTISDGNLVVASGHGIDFSDTVDNTGSTSELFDDYEEGAWTPVPNLGTFSTSTAKYIKIGNVVTFQIYGSVSGGITSTDGYSLTLPIAVAQYGTCAINSNTGAGSHPVGQIDTANVLRPKDTSNNPFNGTDMTGHMILCSGSYLTS